MELPGGLIVAALMAVNSVGNVIGADGEILAGLRAANGGGFISALDAMTQFAANQPAEGENTVIGVVATNGALDKAQLQKVAQMAHDGIARAVNPSHTLYDGDTIFALADRRNARGCHACRRARSGDGRRVDPPRRPASDLAGGCPRNRRRHLMDLPRPLTAI